MKTKTEEENSSSDESVHVTSVYVCMCVCIHGMMLNMNASIVQFRRFSIHNFIIPTYSRLTRFQCVSCLISHCCGTSGVWGLEFVVLVCWLPCAWTRYCFWPITTTFVAELGATPTGVFTLAPSVLPRIMKYNSSLVNLKLWLVYANDIESSIAITFLVVLGTSAVISNLPTTWTICWPDDADWAGTADWVRCVIKYFCPVDVVWLRQAFATRFEVGLAGPGWPTPPPPPPPAPPAVVVVPHIGVACWTTRVGWVTVIEGLPLVVPAVAVVVFRNRDTYMKKCSEWKEETCEENITVESRWNERHFAEKKP